MTLVTDLYRQLFGREGTSKGTDIDMSEHGRVGDVSTGQPYKHVAIVDPTNGYKAAVTADGKLDVNATVSSSPPSGLVDTNNSTTSTLGIGAVFTGTGTDVLNYSGITVLVDADVPGTLKAQFSPDNSDWHDGEEYSIPALTAGSAKFFTPPVQSRYFRLVYTNGATGQSRFHIHTVLKPNSVKWSSHNINSNLHDDDDAELNVSVLKLRTAQNNYVSGAATNGGNFKVSIEEVNGSTDFATETTLSALNNKIVTYTEGDTDASVTGIASMWKNGGNTIRPTSHEYPLPVSNHFEPGTLDEFGHLVTGSVNNQIDVQFYRSDGSVGDLVTETNSNGGTATATNGMATFSATTTANSQAKGVTTTSTTYTAGAEIYVIFTAGWTGTGSGTSYQRIGLYDSNNGFFIGYEGGTFYATVRKGGSDVGVAKASFSVDPLTGGAESRFTRNGTPEAINLENLNVFRIRFGWVGSAPINFEVLSPDGDWVTFHKILQPNLSNLPHINNADLPITCDVNSGNSGAALTLITNCWAAGTTQALSKINSTLTTSTLANLTRAVITGETTAGGGGFVNVKVTPSGAVSTDTTITALPNEGQQTMANSISVAIASNQSTLPVKETRSSTGTATQVADTNSSTTILASNANRLGATIYNDSSALLYILFASGTASSTNYSARVYSNGYIECPAHYTGIISGIWATDPNDGAARVTEYT